MSYKVRDAEIRDVYRLADLSKEVLDESIYSHLAFDREKTANLIMNGIKRTSGYWLRIIVDADNQAVGGILGWCGPLLTGPDKVAYDVTMMINADHRGKCLKEFLIIAMEFKDWAISEGAKLIKLGVSSGIKIDSASRFLERLGYERIGAMHGFRVGV